MTDQENRIYGCSEQQMKEFMNSESFEMHGLRMTLMSMLSDAQELGSNESQRKLLNRVKFIISEMLPGMYE